MGSRIAILTIVAACFAYADELSLVRKHYERNIGNIKALVGKAGLVSEDEVGQHLGIEGAIDRFVKYAYDRINEAQAADVRAATNLRALEEGRTDKQLGALPGAGGTTSLVSKGAVPAILSFAVENGALIKAEEGTSATFRGNLIGLPKAFAGSSLDAYDNESPTIRFLRRVSYSFTLDTSREQPDVPDEAGDEQSRIDQLRSELRKTRQQISNWTVRVDLLNRRDVRNKDNYKVVTDTVGPIVDRYLKVSNPVARMIIAPWYAEWKQESVRAFDRLDTDDVDRAFAERIEELYSLVMANLPDMEKAITESVEALRAIQSTRKRVFDRMAKRPLVALEYVNTRQLDLTDLSTFRLIAEAKLPRTGGEFTLNASGTMFNHTANSPQRWRDTQIALQADFPFGRGRGRLADAGAFSPVLTFAGLAEWLREKTPVVFAGSTFMAEPGEIYAAQAKLTVPIKGSGLKIPLAFSIANRTELIRERNVSANVGVTFDFDSLVGVFK